MTKNLWEGCKYMIIDEVSMLSCQTMVALNAQLMKIKNHSAAAFGGVNIIFFGDFLQFPAVSRLDLYLDSPQNQYASGHRLWHSLNAAVILRQQMRQVDDPEYTALLQRVRYRVPSEDDIAKLNARIGACLVDFWNTSVIVRRHSLCQMIKGECSRPRPDWEFPLRTASPRSLIGRGCPCMRPTIFARTREMRAATLSLAFS